MWVAEYVDDLMQDKTTIQKRLIGPICCIGRKSDCDIVFNDKTVSRRHLEIRIPTDINVDTLEVIDLNSTFKSYVNEVILVPNSKSIIKSGSILRLGGGNSCIRLVYRRLVFTSTRLDADEKNRLKQLSAEIGAKYSDSGNEWSHLFASKFSATVKILLSLVSKRPVVTVEWLSSFASPNLKATSVTIPPHSDFFPQQSETLMLHDPTAPRSDILKDFKIYLTHKSHEQYLAIIKGCGGEAIQLYNVDVQQAKALLQGTASQSSSQGKTVFRLHDESVTYSGDPALWQYCIDHIRPLELGAIAKAVIQLKLPDLSNAVAMQMESTFLSAAEESHGQTVDIFTNLGSDHKHPTLKLSLPLLSSPVPIKEVPTVPAVEMLPVTEEVIQTADPVTSPVKTKQPKVSKAKTPKPMKSSAVPNKEPPVNTPAAAPVDASVTEKVSQKLKSPPPIVSAGETEWIEVHATLKVTQEVPHLKAPHSPTSDSAVAETVEMHIPMKLKQTAVSGNRSGGIVRVSGDVRKFRKNAIPHVDDLSRICKRDMILMLPKESEREVQLRLDDELDGEVERKRDELFADRIGIRPKKARVN